MKVAIESPPAKRVDSVRWHFTESCWGPNDSAGTSAFFGDVLHWHTRWPCFNDFRERVEKLLKVAWQKRTSLLCAAGLIWRRYRRLVSDFLIAQSEKS
jgi:hypothetical protein